MALGLKVFVALCSAVSVCRGVELFVPSEYETIQEAASSVGAYDTVRLEPSVYSGEGFVNITGFTSGNLLASVAGPEVIIIDLKDGQFCSCGIRVEDITFRGGATAIQSGSATFGNCRFENNQVGFRSDPEG